MGKDLDMWEIFVIIARHIQTYMNAEIFLLGFLTICVFCIPCGYNLYRPHLFISKTKKYILYILCTLTILMFFLSIFFPMTYGLGLIFYGIKDEYKCYLNEDNLSEDIISSDRRSAVLTAFMGFLFLLYYYT